MSDDIVKEAFRDELLQHFRRIIDMGLTAAEWSNRESSDMFQSDHFSGGFDAIEGEFLFSFYPDEGGEFWFGFSLTDVEMAGKTGNLPRFNLRTAD